jgi:coatomer protein complex subunit gamma
VDSDDEVRDRATLYHQLLSCDDKALVNQYILNTLQVSIVALEKALAVYIGQPAGQHNTPFNIKDVPLATANSEEMKGGSHHQPSPGGGLLKTKPMSEHPNAAANKKAQQAAKELSFADEMAKIPELSRIQLGGLFKTCDKAQLTESETEYVVSCTKHVFSKHIVFQFRVENTLPDQLLENVRLQLEVPEGFQQIANVAIPKLPYGTPSNAYAVMVWPEDLEVASGATVGAILKFIVKDCDPDTGLPDSDEGYDDEYAVNK